MNRVGNPISAAQEVTKAITWERIVCNVIKVEEKVKAVLM
jgi:hypothetical protein